MVAAFKAAVQQGIDPEQFWRLTPYLTHKAMEGLSKGRLSMAWHTAAFQRTKKLEKLDHYVGRDRPADPGAKLRSMLSPHVKKVEQNGC